jgi:pimeloyl-ACP methyl ester carboxylesterase
METAQNLARQRQWVSRVVATPTFDLFTFGPRAFVASEPLVVYVEGDGYAFISPTQLSDDPTPRDPVGLELAVADPRPNVVYVARPCQYVTGPHLRNCHPAYWSTARFAEPVVAAVESVVARYVADSGATRVAYVGYSGGGAVAALVAARRSDSAALVTVAGVLDHATWTSLDGMTPLGYSLNPADFADRLAGLPQVHFVGGDDDVVPEVVARAFAARFPADRKPGVVVLPGYDHVCCWSAHWPALLQRTPLFRESP